MKKGNESLIAADVKNVSLTNYDVLIETAVETGYIKAEDVAKLLAFRDYPENEQWTQL